MFILYYYALFCLLAILNDQFTHYMLTQVRKNTFIHTNELCLTPQCEVVDSPALLNDTNSLMLLNPLVLNTIFNNFD